MAISRRFSEICQIIGQKSQFSHTLYSVPPLKVMPSGLSTDPRWQKTRIMGLSGWKNFDKMFSCFDTNHACDTHTDIQTDRRKCRSIYPLASHHAGKNWGEPRLIWKQRRSVQLLAISFTFLYSRYSCKLQFFDVNKISGAKLPNWAYGIPTTTCSTSEAVVPMLLMATTSIWYSAFICSWVTLM